MTPPDQTICPLCKEPTVKIIKHLKDGTRTETYAYVCVNRKCGLYINLAKVKSWVKE